MSIYQPRSGRLLEQATGSLALPEPGILYLLSGEVRCRLGRGPLTARIKYEPGAVIGLGLEHQPDLRYLVTRPITAYWWSWEEFKLVVGQEMELAIQAVISLSHQQRLLNQMLPQDAGVNPEDNLVRSNFEISTEAPVFGERTQQGLFQIAFYGTAGVNLDILARFGRLFNPGEVLCKEGEIGNELFLIVDGLVEISCAGKVLGYYGKGEIVGEMAILEAQERSATIRAQSEVQVLALTREHFQMIFQLHPSWTIQLLNGFCQRLSDTWRLFLS